MSLLLVAAVAASLSQAAEFGVDAGALKMAPLTPEQKIERAEQERRGMLITALGKIDSLLKKRPGEDAGAPPPLTADDQAVVDAMNAWMYTTQVNNFFWDELQKARNLIKKNQDLNGKPPFRRDDASADYAYVKDAGDPTLGIYFSLNFMNSSPNCRREVILHEHFHFVVGAQHFYSTKDPAEALKCPHHLAELVSQIATGVTRGCESAATY